MSDEILRLEHIEKSYKMAKGELKILEDISLTLSSGEIVAIVGQSGSGKSTLLSIAALLLSKDGGKIYYKGEDCDLMGTHQIEALRSKAMGFVFQSSLLLQDFSALENVAMPLLIQGENKKSAYEKAMQYLDMVELSDRASHRPGMLSGGERQRIAIARSLSSDPYVIYADEPTGALDEASADNVANILLNSVKKEGKGMILVTHNLALASLCDRVLSLKGGKFEK